MWKFWTKTVLAMYLTIFSVANAESAGNQWSDSFNTAKRTLERQIYFDHRITLYCGAAFDAKNNVTLPPGFLVEKHAKRAEKIEWEHVVPAENFGRAFPEWRPGTSGSVKAIRCAWTTGAGRSKAANVRKK